MLKHTAILTIGNEDIFAMTLFLLYYITTIISTMFMNII